MMSFGQSEIANCDMGAQAMDSIIDHCKKACQSAKLIPHPFPHYVIDDFLPAEIFAELVNSGLSEHALLKRRFETSLEAGKSVHGNEEMNAAANMPIKLLGGPFGSALISELFGIDGVSSMFDRPNFGGYYPFHQMNTGGLLGSHVDHSYSIDGQVHVANCIFYANSNWADEWGGETVLFDDIGANELARVSPKPNRLLVFMHSSKSFHGVDVVKCPGSEKRMTYYMDYYTTKGNAQKAYERIQAGSASNKLRSWRHGTIFLPFHPLGKLQFPDLTSVDRIKKEAGYVFHYLKYLWTRLTS